MMPSRKRCTTPRSWQLWLMSPPSSGIAQLSCVIRYVTEILQNKNFDVQFNPARIAEFCLEDGKLNAVLEKTVGAVGQSNPDPPVQYRVTYCHNRQHSHAN